MIKNNDYDVREEIVFRAHQIFDKMLLFEVNEMKEDKVRSSLESNNMSDHDTQDTYLGLVREYDEKTRGIKALA